MERNNKKVGIGGMRLNDIVDTLKSKGTIYIIRFIGMVCLFWIIFGRVLGIDEHLESFFEINLIKLLPITIWIIIEIVDRVPSIVEKSLTAEYKLKSPKSEKIKEEIKERFKNSRKIRIFSYTGETLDDYLGWHDVRDRDKEAEIQLLCRNWNIERKDQDEHNRNNEGVVSGKKKKWNKAKMIKTKAEEFKEKFASTRIKFDQRFYDTPPFYKGYIFNDKELYVGEYEWLKDPPTGGSQYKGSGSPLTYYSDDTELGKNKIMIVLSRFEHLWKNGKTYGEVEAEETNG